MRFQKVNEVERIIVMERKRSVTGRQLAMTLDDTDTQYEQCGVFPVASCCHNRRKSTVKKKATTSIRCGRERKKQHRFMKLSLIHGRMILV